MTRIVISSVGSLVGQNILDSLQGRREGIEVVGINSAAAAAGNFRCDRIYLAPPAAREDAYLQRLAAVLRSEQPDLVLPGRDDDVLAWAQLKETLPERAATMPIGPPRLARILDDKWTSREFALARGLPYVDSAPAQDTAAAAGLLQRHGYPLLAKPRRGNGSRGVRILFDDAQRRAIAALPDYLLQPYLEPEAELMAWRDLCRDGTPLFHAPTLPMIACQAIIGPDHRIRGLCCTVAELVMGRLERTWRIDDPGVASTSLRYAEAFAAEGWIGALNLQGRRDAGGSFHVFELNGRFTGGTTARLHLGFDEVALLVEAFTGRRLPPRPAVDGDRVVTKSLTEFVTRRADIERLLADGCWRRDDPGDEMP